MGEGKRGERSRRRVRVVEDGTGVNYSGGNNGFG